MRLPSPRAGQIVIPAMLIFPSLMLFVYLIYETAKLSREKIRHQFAMDAAAFVEMTNYSDFLNRTAYVNGAFPMRIFDEGYGDFMAECEGKTEKCEKVTYASILYANGAFPHEGGSYPSGSHTAETTLPTSQWQIRYGGAGAGKNDGPPTLPEPLKLFTLQNAYDYWHALDLAVEIYKLYFQIYSLLGSVEDAQYSVLKRLSADHSFMKKSYWLNTGDSMADADSLVNDFRSKVPAFDSSAVVKPFCQQQLTYCGNRHLGGTGIQPYRPECTDPPVTLQTSAGCSSGLFQIMWVDANAIKTLQEDGGSGYPGIPLSMTWAVPSKNYWNVNFTAMSEAFRAGRPELHTTISLRGDLTTKPAVWPDPTPKFQVRQFP